MDPLHTAGSTHILEAVERLKQAIWKKRPILGEIMQKHGNKFLYDYSLDFMDVNKAPGLDERKPELIALVEELVAGRLGADVGKGVAEQLSRLALVSTADHHAYIDHPSWVNSNIVSGIPIYTDPNSHCHYLICFSFASISANNPSGYPRGVLFNDGKNKLHIRLPLLPDKLKMSTVYGTRKYSSTDLEKALTVLRKKENGGHIPQGKADAVESILTECFSAGDVRDASHLCSQITRINYRFWQKIFHGPNHEKTSVKPVPDLVYLDIETLVTQLFLRIHLKDTSSLLHHLLFDPEYIAECQKSFDGLVGGFSLTERWGTYMFWGVGKDCKRVPAFLHDGMLVFEDNTCRISWTPEGIGEALRGKKIFPSMLLCYITIPLYYGIKCLGGHCQVNDLTELKRAWQNILRSVGNESEANAIIPVQTKELGGYGLVLTYLRLGQDDYAQATGIDMALQDEDTSFEKYVELSKKVTLLDLLLPVLPEMYLDFYSPKERDPALLAVSLEQIFHASGLKKKLTT